MRRTLTPTALQERRRRGSGRRDPEVRRRSQNDRLARRPKAAARGGDEFGWLVSVEVRGLFVAVFAAILSSVLVVVHFYLGLLSIIPTLRYPNHFSHALILLVAFLAV